MKVILLVGMALAVSACGMRDIHTMNGTEQVNNLNDLDKDGVIEARERCNETYAGAAIDNYGCGKIKPINQSQQLAVLFPNDSFYLDPQYYGEIEEIAVFMRQFPNTTVTIEGHCSRTGSYEHNLTLSQKRAEAVTSTLSQQFGIAPERMTAIGYSYDRPVDPSDTKQAHVANRRVIANLVGEDTTADMKWTIFSVDESDE
ncbi:OmpA family protein [Shewanella sp. NIFS-20-20]|uniref:OmpA family protein n=1 Tax=Shewanella sp. NIFS-20-20 TaxID=2853806 RepID=UPI001C443E09|nr:OmpA family protein [Shewanella sp. NIFS-20-20]MBV7317156.1 OmpA family protein [Shewanella sp. NIFS-20-20]